MSLRGWLAAAVLLPVLAAGYMVAAPETLPVKLRMALQGDLTARIQGGSESFWLTPALAAVTLGHSEAGITVIHRSGGDAPETVKVASAENSDSMVTGSLPRSGMEPRPELALPMVITVKKTDRYPTPPDAEKKGEGDDEPSLGATLYLTGLAKDLSPYAQSVREDDENKLEAERLAAEATAAAAQTPRGVSYKGESEAEFQERERRCLATAIYFEARGEPVTGQKAVAQVVMNRVRSPEYPDTICGVVYQGQHRRTGCQFSFTCDGKADIAKDETHWAMAMDLSRKTTQNEVWLDDVGHSTHYHANYVSPRWIRDMKRIQSIGAHIFYKLRNEKPYEVTAPEPAGSPAKGLAYTPSG